MHRSATRGFTLIELLVVIAIIAILASIILASLNSARTKSRDARRVADLKELQLALELYNNDNSQYPPAGAGVYTAQLVSSLSALVSSGYISVLSTDPVGGGSINGANAYTYQPLYSSGGTFSACTGSGATPCNSYILKAVLENNSGNILNSSATGTFGTVTCTASGTTYPYCVHP